MRWLFKGGAYFNNLGFLCDAYSSDYGTVPRRLESSTRRAAVRKLVGLSSSPTKVIETFHANLCSVVLRTVSGRILSSTIWYTIGSFCPPGWLNAQLSALNHYPATRTYETGDENILFYPSFYKLCHKVCYTDHKVPKSGKRILSQPR